MRALVSTKSGHVGQGGGHCNNPGEGVEWKAWSLN